MGLRKQRAVAVFIRLPWRFVFSLAKLIWQDYEPRCSSGRLADFTMSDLPLMHQFLQTIFAPSQKTLTVCFSLQTLNKSWILLSATLAVYWQCLRMYWFSSHRGCMLKSGFIPQPCKYTQLIFIKMICMKNLFCSLNGAIALFTERQLCKLHVLHLE